MKRLISVDSRHFQSLRSKLNSQRVLRTVHKILKVVPMAELNLDESALEDITLLIESADAIEPVIAEAEDVGPRPSIFGISRTIATRLGLSRNHVLELLSALWSSHRLMTRRSFTPQQLVDALTQSLREQTEHEWQQEYLAKWGHASECLVRALAKMDQDHPILISQKAQSIAFAHQNILLSARLVTDVRPVFDFAGENILETIVTHTLAVEYATGHHEPSAIYLSMNSEDLERLKKECERAETKATVILESMHDLNPYTLPDTLDS